MLLYPIAPCTIGLKGLENVSMIIEIQFTINVAPLVS